MEWTDDPARFAELREPWNALAWSPFLSWDWLDAWWRCFGDETGLFVEALWRGEELAGGIALSRKGRALRALANKESDLFCPVARDAEDLAAVARGLASAPCSRITLIGVPSEGGADRRIAEALRSEVWLVHAVIRERCPIVATSGSFQEYRHTSLSANARQQIARARRRLERAGAVEIRALEPVAAGELDRALGQCLELEAAGRKRRSGDATLSDPATERFLRTVCGRFQERGALHLSTLRLDGALLAFALTIEHGGRVYQLKTSYDERRGELSPGQVLQLALVERCFEIPGIEAEELLGPEMRWKERFATHARETMVLHCYRRAPAGLARYAAQRHLAPALRPVRHRARLAMARVRSGRRATPPRSS